MRSQPSAKRSFTLERDASSGLGGPQPIDCPRRRTVRMLCLGRRLVGLGRAWFEAPACRPNREHAEDVPKFLCGEYW